LRQDSQQTERATWPPCAHHGARARAVGARAFVHGGQSNFVLDDLYVLDLAAGAWAEVHAAGRPPPPRHGHAAAAAGGQLWLFGGVDALTAPAATLHRLSLPAADAPASAKWAARPSAPVLKSTSKGSQHRSACARRRACAAQGRQHQPSACSAVWPPLALAHACGASRAQNAFWCRLVLR